MNRDVYVILTLFLAVYLILTMYHPGGLLAYVVPSLCWTAIALTTLTLAGIGRIKSWTNRRIVLMAILVAVFQVFLLIDAGLLNKFGKSPMSFTPTGIAINITLVSSTLLGTELSRGYLARNLCRKRPVLTLTAITLLYTFTKLSIFALIDFKNPFIYSKYMGETVLPTLTENLLATYLALISGPVASLAYRAPLQAFWWFSPILPDIPWGYKSLIGVMTPTIGFIAISMATTQRDLVKARIPVKREPTIKVRERQKSMKLWLAISIFLVLTVWTSTGLLGFQPSIIASGSMRPTLEVGDIAIIVKTPVERIKPGDIIQYATPEGMVLHRVVDIQDGYFITKGDACSTPDPDPVHPLNVRGRLIAVIPKLGWASIYMKEAIKTVWNVMAENPMVMYVTLASTIPIATLATLKSRRRRRWRRWTR